MKLKAVMYGTVLTVGMGFIAHMFRATHKQWEVDNSDFNEYLHID